MLLLTLLMLLLMLMTMMTKFDTDDAAAYKHAYVYDDHIRVWCHIMHLKFAIN